MSDFCRRYLVAMQKLLDMECHECSDTYELSMKLTNCYTTFTRDPYSEQGWKTSLNTAKFPNHCVKGKKQELLPRSGNVVVSTEKKDQCKHNHSGVQIRLLTNLAAMPVTRLDDKSSYPCVFQIVTGACTSNGCGYYHSPPGTPDSNSDAESIEDPPHRPSLRSPRPLIDRLNEGVVTSPEEIQQVMDEHRSCDRPFFQTSRRPTTHPCGVANNHFQH